MTCDEFDSILLRRLGLTSQVLGSKAVEYAAGGDRLHNFKEAAKLDGTTPAEALRGMLRKHWVSVMDMVGRIDRGDCWPEPALIDEKIGDAVNYLILLEAVLLSRNAGY
jgi:hypothetical protein